MTTICAMTGEEFEAAYAARAGVTVEWLREHGRIVVRCDCDYEDCEGWGSVSWESAYEDALMEMEMEIGRAFLRPKPVLLGDSIQGMWRRVE